MARTYETIRNAQLASSAVGAVTDFDASFQHGLISKLTITNEQEKKILRDTSYGTGGAFSTHYRLTSIMGEVSFKEEILENMKLAWRATSTTATGINTLNVLASGPIEKRLLIKVVSELNNQDYDIFEIYRAKFSLADSVDLISDDFAEYNLKFDVLKNPNATGVDDLFMTVKSFRFVAP